MRATLLTTTAILLSLPGTAIAQKSTSQAAPIPAPTDHAATDEAGLGDIVVTAQRRVESSQRAAIPLAVIDGATLTSAGITQASRLNELAPALSIEPSSTGNLIFLRGVGNFTVTAASDPAIAFNYDGVYIGRPTSTTGVFYDLERVEILKGPQGILYGRNATGGAINILPAQPRIGETSGYVTAAYGNYSTFNAEGALNLPVGENGAFRIAATTSNHDGYLQDGTSDENHSSAVHLDRSHTDTQFMGQHLIGPPGNKALEHCSLAPGQAFHMFLGDLPPAIDGNIFVQSVEQTLQDLQDLRLQERLFKKVCCPQLHGADGGQHVAVPGHDNHGQFGTGSGEAAKHVEPIHPRHPDVEQDATGREARCSRYKSLAAIKYTGLKASCM